MNITSMLAELRTEIQHLNEAILALQRLASGGGKRRGRPPKWLASSAKRDGPRTRKPFSAETRKRMADAQRKRWAARKAKGA